MPTAFVPQAGNEGFIEILFLGKHQEWLDVYQERGSQKGGAARVRLMDAVCLTGTLL
jgi:hypothetical protein